MEQTRRIALYARVSSQRQADEATIQSQLAALKQRIVTDGFTIDDELVFQDDGCSGASLQRPALERLRDLAYAGGIDQLYVHSPDRLARKFVHQAVLLEEFAKRHVEVVFLNQPITEASPETNLLLQMQGMIAEYEREKILERTRRGRRFRARQGHVSVLGQAPYGYRYVPKHQGDGAARYDLVFDEVRVVRDLFRWIGLEGLTLGMAAQRLTSQHVPTRTGAARWNRNTLRGILLNPAYYGEAHWGKTRVQERSSNPRARRGQPQTPRREKVSRPTLPSEQEIIRVPALIGRDLFDAVAERLAENRQHQRTRSTGPSFVLSGLLVCGRCGSAYIGRRHRRPGKSHVYYRCLGSDKYRHGGEALCRNASVRASVEQDVWNDVCELLQNPQRLRAERQRRQEPTSSTTADASSLRGSITRLKRQLSRLMDLYETGYLEKDEFAVRGERLKERLRRAEGAYAEQRQAEQQTEANQALLANFEQFAQQVRASLDQADFATKRTILSVLIKSIEVGDEQIHIVYKVQPLPFVPSPERGCLQHCLKFRTFASRRAPCKGMVFQWVQVPPGKFSRFPAGSNPSGGGGNEAVEALGGKGHCVTLRESGP
jgi:site-specific DNA recombinase